MLQYINPIFEKRLTFRLFFLELGKFDIDLSELVVEYLASIQLYQCYILPETVCLFLVQYEVDEEYTIYGCQFKIPFAPGDCLLYYCL